MESRLQIALILGVLIWGAVIIMLLKRRRLHLKYTLIWLAALAAMIIALIFPDTMEKIAHFFGIYSVVNFIFLIGGGFVLCILLTVSVILSHMNERIFTLVQKQGILEKRIRELEAGERKENERDKNS